MPNTIERQRRLVSLKTAVEETELSVSTIKRLINSGKLERVKVMGATRIVGSSYETFLADLRRPVEQAA